MRSPERRVLLVKTTKWRGKWGVPGGKVEYGESLEAALKREFLEETGLEIERPRLVLVQEAVLSGEFYREDHFVMLNYLAEAGSEAVSPNQEITEYAWLDPARAARLDLNSYTRKLLKAAADHW